MKNHIEQLIRAALEQIQQSENKIFSIPVIQIDATKDKQFGDFASNIALILAKQVQCKPRELAEKIVQALPKSENIAKVEIAGPGFINFYLAQHALYTVIPEILDAGDNYGRSDVGKGKKVLVEFVSSNPTGPLHVGHGRHAAFGAVVSDLLQTVGYQVQREYYINDAGRQMDILAISVWLRYLNLCGENFDLPQNAYQGDYIIQIAEELKKQHNKQFVFSAEKVLQNLPETEDKEIYIDALIARAKELLQQNYQTVFDVGLKSILADIHQDLAEFGAHFDKWFSEREFVQKDVVDRMIKTLQNKDLVYEREGALWFRSTNFNDEKDRVLERANGQRTYFANDLAYHINKFERGFDFAIDVFGSDHHGYVPRMKSGLQAFDVQPDKLMYLLLQFVNLFRGGKPVGMSTRSGSFVTLRELRNEVGNDAARFFYVMRRREQPIDFDLDLAKAKTSENPVFYVQYAHARICSVLNQLKEKEGKWERELGLQNLTLLSESQELQLISRLSRYREILINAAHQYEPHILTQYLRELANDFHVYYNAHQFLVDDNTLRQARLTLILGTRQVIANGLKLLGVSRPESM